MRFMPLALSAVIAASFISTPVEANADQLVANICDYVKGDDKNRLRKKLKESRVKLRNVYTEITCDGSSLLRTAYTSNSSDTGEYIAKQLAGSDLSKPEADGKTILDWANANGHGGSAITSAINSKIGN